MSYPNNPEYDNNDNLVSACDWLGNRFKIGDKVIYAIAAGRGQMLAIGKVTALRMREARWGSVPKDIEVQVITEKTSGNWNNGPRTRPAWVNPMNITAVKGIEAKA